MASTDLAEHSRQKKSKEQDTDAGTSTVSPRERRKASLPLDFCSNAIL